jgi:hypothetical protein
MDLILDQWAKSAGRERSLYPDQLLRALPDASIWEWVVADGFDRLELAGVADQARNLEEWAAAGTKVPGHRLLEALEGEFHVQFIWGDLRAFERGADDPLLTISACDSTHFEINGRADLVALLADAFSWARCSN